MKQRIELHVNGESHELLVAPTETLLDVLRDRLGLTGAKRGCGLGACGACAVLADGRPVNSCLVLAVEAVGFELVTIEGLHPAPGLDPVQQAFVEHGAVQCGFCTPGMVLSARALLDECPRPSDEQIRAALSGNVCRCTGYVKVVEAVHAAARGGKESAR